MTELNIYYILKICLVWAVIIIAIMIMWHWHTGRIDKKIWKRDDKNGPDENSCS